MADAERKVVYILIFGNLIDGFTFRGPFATEEEAIAYGDPIAEEWYTAEVLEPDVDLDNT